MKRVIFLLTFCVLLWTSCGDPMNIKDSKGNVYGVVTDLSSAEPMRAAGVSLFVINGTDQYNKPILSLLLKTVTYDDGHFEYNDIDPGEYYLTVEMDGYDSVAMSITVEAGRTARADMQMSKIDTGLTVKTGTPTVNVTTVAFKGEYSYRKSSPNEYGFVYGNNQNPTKEKDVVIKASKYFVAEANDVKKGLYHVRAYATNSLGTTYGEDVEFEISGFPCVSTLPVSNIGDHTATLNGRIGYKGDPAYSEKGFVYSSSFSNPTVDDPQTSTTKKKVTGNSDDFSVNIDGLTTNTTYYVRAYVINDNSTSYGESVSFVATSYVPYVVVDALAIQRTDNSTGINLTDAIALCENSRVGGFSDWHLPTLSELSVMYTNKGVIGGFYNGLYWSSTFSGSLVTGSYYFAINFKDGSTSAPRKDTNCRVRCVRTL